MKELLRELPRRLTVAPPPVNQIVAAVPGDLIWRMGIDKYHEMIRAGVLEDDDPVELLEGWLVYKMPKNRAHTLATRRTRTALERHLPGGWYVEAQEPITFRDSEPEPDVAVIQGTPADYPGEHPGPSDVAMLVEVSDTTLDRDRGWKQQIYARSRVPVYWIVNLSDRRFEVYSNPGGSRTSPRYRSRVEFDEHQHVPLVIAGTTVANIAVRDLLP